MSDNQETAFAESNLPAPIADAFDVDQWEETATAEYVVKHPKTGEATPLVLILAGPEHPLRKKKAFDRIRHLRKEAAKTGKLKFDDPADEEHEETAFIASCILGWTGLVRSGIPVEYSSAAAAELVTPKSKRWLRDQVKVAMDENEAFIKVCGKA